MQPFSLLIKGASSDCNLACSYCFYRNLPIYRNSTRRMSEATLEKMIETYLATDQPQYVFSWQGGEPSLLGLDFYKRAVFLQEKYAKPATIIGNGFQTNATCLNEPFADFFAEYRFLVGISIDGPAEIHDLYRRTPSGSGSFDSVMKAFNMLVRRGVACNALTLVTTANVDKPGLVYRFLRDQGFTYQQYIPCVEFDRRGKTEPYAINGLQWGRFLCGLFEAWLKDSDTVSVRLFDSILSVMFGKNPGVCHMAKTCRQYLVVEHNGDIYPCDFFVKPEMLLGNVFTDSWERIWDLPAYRKFGTRKTAWHDSCNHCEYLKFCYGDCPKHRLILSNNITKSHLCDGWRFFYSHSLPEFKRLKKRKFQSTSFPDYTDNP